MKIAIVYDVIYPYVKGGVEKRNWEIARRLAKKHEVHIFGMKFWDGSDVIEKEGVYLHGVCKPKKLYKKKGERSIIQALYFSMHLIKPLMKEKLDVIDCSNFPYFPMFVCKLKRKPLVATWHEVWGKKYWLEYIGWKGIFGHMVEVVSAKLPDNVVSVSEPTKKDFEKMLGRKSQVVHNGISLKDIKKIKARKDKNKIITVGRLMPFKNVDSLIKAMPKVIKKNKKAHLVIIGEGPERKNLEQMAKPLGKHVEFKDFVENHDDLLKEIKSAGIFVTQSSREGFGIIVMEALACGTAVVIPPYLSEFPYAKFCTIADEKKLANGILNPKKANISSVSGFDWGFIAQEMERVYLEAAG